MRWLLLCLLLPAALFSEPLRVMSFNVRFPSKDDGPNLWETRRGMFIESIRQLDPDLLGTQELFHLQGQYIVQQLPAYRWFGLSRRGNQTDEHMGVFYKPSRLKLLKSGDFWLSETPAVPGSSSWDMSLPRMVTWGLFEIQSTRRRFYLYNTHFPHRPQDDAARTRCASLIAARAAALDPKIPFILTGDFNAAAPSSQAYQTLTQAGLTDAYQTATHRFGPEGTFNGFKGITTGPRIDWILYRGLRSVLQYQTNTINSQGRYPSDHFPVFAVIDVP